MTDRLLPVGYDDFLRELKERIRNAQIRAALVQYGVNKPSIR